VPSSLVQRLLSSCGKRRIGRLVAIALAGAALAVPASALPALAASKGAPGATSLVPGLPPGVPPAALSAPPPLPEPPPGQWPFPAAAFPHTEGASRLAGGALYWTGFLYGDHGAKGIPVQDSGPFGTGSSLSAPVGTYVYPQGPAEGNGANIFGAAVGVADGRTWWRVDWNTLVSPDVPIAEWGIDTGSGPATSVWPASAGVTSPGERVFLLVSGKGAWLIDPAGRATPVGSLGGSLYVDTVAKSFIVALPTAVLQPRGTWQVRLVAGLADAAGDAFAPVPPADGAAPGEPNVYDVGFRTYTQESPQLSPYNGPDPAGAISAATALASGAHAIAYDNFWMDGAQATALAAGTVAPFSAQLDWSRLEAGVTTPSPRPTGWTDRWYVSSLDFGQGVSDTSSQVSPNLLGRVQPYGIYVPSGYRPAQAAPLTFLLHSLDVNLNQYAVLDPRQVSEACQDRGSICVTPESRGLGGWYTGYAEVDFWQVWHAVADAYRLDPYRTVLSGYSMGGYGTYLLGLEYPDVFAGAVVLSGPPVCGIRVVQGVNASAGSGICADDGDTGPMVGNARWLPYVIEQGVADELVPVAGVVQQVQLFDAAGERYRFELYPAEDHLVNATQDGFRSEYRAIGSPRLAVDPGVVDFTWYPGQVQPQLGIGPTGDYWVQGLVGASSAPGALASVQAESGERPEPAVTVERTVSADPAAQPTPRVTRTLSWVLGAVPPPQPVIRAGLDGVAAATFELAAAGFSPGTAGTATVSTTTTTVLGLAQLAPGALVSVDGQPAGRAGPDGSLTVRLAAGTHVIRWK